MTIKKFKENIKTYRKACDKDRDPFLIVHFSREENKYHGAHERIDRGVR